MKVLISQLFPKAIECFLDNHKSFSGWAIDSGAYSVWTRGLEKLRVRDYADRVKEWSRVKTPELVFTLDVIGDPKASMLNTSILSRLLGSKSNVVPVFHLGESSAYLRRMDSYTIIGLGGLPRSIISGKKIRASIDDPNIRRLYNEVFLHRDSGKKWIHGLGVNSEKRMLEYPFSSCDSALWSIQPKFGQWKSIGKAYRAGHCGLGLDIDHYLSIESKVRSIHQRYKVGKPFDFYFACCSPADIMELVRHEKILRAPTNDIPVCDERAASGDLRRNAPRKNVGRAP